MTRRGVARRGEVRLGGAWQGEVGGRSQETCPLFHMYNNGVPCPNCKCDTCIKKYALRRARKTQPRKARPASRWKRATPAGTPKPRRKRKRSTYAEYLRSPRWAELRKETIKRDGDCCNVCGGEQSLHVHHGTYARLGAELPGDLVTLCSPCHFAYHHRKSRSIRVISCLSCNADVYQAIRLTVCRLCNTKPADLPIACKPPSRRRSGVPDPESSKVKV